MSGSGVMLSGWLRKSPPEKKLRRNAWKKRWFVLRSGRLSGDPNVLEYFRHQGSRRPIRAISLDECSQIDANVPIKYEKKDPAQQYVFDIVTKSRTYYLVAESNLEMSSWVRYLCDLCGFNHDNPENPQEIGSQQQTFKAVQPITSRNYQNGTAPLLDNEDGTPLGSEVPMPLPRPRNTITHRSVLIRERNTDANGNIRDDETKLSNQSGSSSNGSGHVSVAGTPNSPRKIAGGEKNGYSFAVDPSLAQGNASEYLLLADFKTAQAAKDQPENLTLLTEPSRRNERRSSTDSVFTHEGAVSDSGSDVITEQPLQSHMRFVNNMRKQRLDSMPDCPPPAPPNKVGSGNRPMINTMDERGYSYPPDDTIDEDVVTEARKRSCRSSHGLSPIDDSELNRVPLNLQREFRVDEMGKPLGGGSHTSSSSAASSRFVGYGRNSSAGNTSGTEYINTADASAEAGFGNFGAGTSHIAMQRYEQQFPIAGRPFMSPTNRSVSSQFTNSPVFFNSPNQVEGIYNSPRGQLYDVPSPLTATYSSPRNMYPYNSTPSKGSIYSSASTLSPYVARGSPMRVSNPHMSPQIFTPKMRRSSSVGQLENVANELASQMNDHKQPGHARRCSIDHRHERIMYNAPTHSYATNQGLYASPAPLLKLCGDIGGQKSNVPPPRPPKSDATVKKTLNELPGQSPVFDRKETKEYFNILRCRSSEEITTTDVHPVLTTSPSISPPHTSVISSVALSESPPHSELVSFGIKAQNLSPAHAKIIKTITVNDEDPSHAKVLTSPTTLPIIPHNAMKDSRSTSSSSSTGSDSTSGSSRSRSPAAVYDIPTASIHLSSPDEKANGYSTYDTPSLSKITTYNQAEGFSLYDRPTSKVSAAASSYSIYDTPSTKAVPDGYIMYDSPTSKASVENHPDSFSNYDTPSSVLPVINSNVHLTDIQDENHPNYELMLDQADALPPEDDVQLYTCMAGASAMINTSPFTTLSKSIGRPPALSEPPPVKRDLKPGRRSLGSDSGESSKQHHSRSSYEDSHSVSSEINSPTNTQMPECPVSPPHATLLHTIATTPVMGTRGFADTLPMQNRTHDRLMPPERPPKHASQSSLSPRTPPSATLNIHLPGRPHHLTYGIDRTHKLTYDNQVTRSPSLTHQAPRQRSVPTAVPGRPPKPYSMTMQSTPPSASVWDEMGYPTRSARDFGMTPTRPPKSSTVFVPDHGGVGHFFPISAAVPPAPMEHVERELKYVELKDFPTSYNDGVSGLQSDNASSGSERLPKTDEGVEYIVLDREKTEALQKMKKAREIELSLQKRNTADTKSNKSGK